MKVSLSTLWPLFKEGIRLGRVATEMSAQAAEDLRQKSLLWGGIALVQGSLQEIESEQLPTSKQSRLNLGCPDTSEDPLFPEEYLQPLFSTGAISLAMGTIAAMRLCSPEHVAEVMRQASEMGLKITDAPTRPDRVTLAGFGEYAHAPGSLLISDQKNRLIHLEGVRGESCDTSTEALGILFRPLVDLPPHLLSFHNHL